jgi:hypothetical protein
MQLRSSIAALLVSFSLQSFAADIRPVRPEPAITPGDLCTRRDRDFTEFRYRERIPYCERNVPSEQKAHIYDVYNVAENKRERYTIDHLIPLSLGGNNADENLWPEHKQIKALRRNLEMETYVLLDRGEITQAQAIRRVVSAKMNPPLEVLVFEGVFYEREELAH